MSEEPTVDAFMRHLQVCVEEARTIADAKEREQRLWQLGVGHAGGHHLQESS